MTPTTLPVGCLIFGFSARPLAFCSSFAANLASASLASSASASSSSASSSLSATTEKSQVILILRRACSTLTVLIQDLFSGSLPLIFRQKFDDDNVTIDGPVHAFSANQEDLLVVRSRIDVSLRFMTSEVRHFRRYKMYAYLQVVVRIRIEVPLMKDSPRNTSLQSRLRQILTQGDQTIVSLRSRPNTHIGIYPLRRLPPRRMPITRTRRHQITQLDLQLIRQAIDIFPCRSGG